MFIGRFLYSRFLNEGEDIPSPTPRKSYSQLSRQCLDFLTGDGERPMMSGLTNVAVFGTGSLGKEHARLYAELAAAGKVVFAGVYDVNAETAKKFAEKYRVKAFASVEEAIANCSAASVVTPTVTHFEL